MPGAPLRRDEAWGSLLTPDKREERLAFLMKSGLGGTDFRIVMLLNAWEVDAGLASQLT